MQQSRIATAIAALVLIVAACTPGGGDSSSRPADSTTTAAGVATSTTQQPAGAPAIAADRVFSGDVLIPEGFTVPDGEVWAFDPAVDTTVEVAANVIVEGDLVMRPASGDVTHTLRFVEIDESRFVGGGVEPLESDVGLWVMDNGRLVAEGGEKVAWGYEWQSEWGDDEVVATPVEPGDYSRFTPVAGPPDVPEPNSFGFKPELINLTRNVRIEGTPEGKTHIFIHSQQPQTIRYVSIRYVGPDLTDPEVRDQNQDQTGRYGLHFHVNDDFSRGSIIEGVVVRDADNHAFVPHASNGITFRDTIAYNVQNEAYWWDPTTRKSPGNATTDLVWDQTIAALVWGTGHLSAAYQLGEGEGLTVTNSVAVGVQGAGADNAGFTWPGTEDGVWVFDNNISHNNEGHGSFVWQNARRTHVVENFTAYNNKKAGVLHGAYRNAYIYRNLTLLGNEVAVESHALSRAATDGLSDSQRWESVETGGSALLIAPHNTPGESPVTFEDCDFSSVIFQEGRHPGGFDFVHCGLEPGDFVLDGIHSDTVVRVQRSDATAFQFIGSGSVTTIEAFAS